MRANAAIIVILLVLSIALGMLLYRRHTQAEAQHKADEELILLHSNEWVQTRAKLDEQVKVNLSLETNLASRVAELLVTSNKLSDVSDTLVKTEAEVKATQEEVAKRDKRIADLEGQNEVLDKQAIDLKTSISNLETQISDTERKLAASEGDRDFLLKELKRLQAEKAELERQFNDLAVLREQVRKLKDELSIARRLDWIRRGLYGATERKGAELLQRGFVAAQAQTNLGLEVEIRRDGETKIKSTLTNSPPANAPPK